MSMDVLLTAIGLFLVMEGIVPFVAPARWRDMFTEVARLADGQIRFVGFAALLLGLIILLL